jgi:hypothetical protein
VLYTSNNAENETENTGEQRCGNSNTHTIMNVAPYNNEINHPQVLLAKLTNKQQYKDTIKGNVDHLINNQQKTPKGLLFLDIWGSLRHASNAALIMLQVISIYIFNICKH